MSEQIAAGWKLVPEHPLPEMLAAWWRTKNTGTVEIGGTYQDDSDVAAYRAMLASAPPAPTPDAGSDLAGRVNSGRQAFERLRDLADCIRSGRGTPASWAYTARDVAEDVRHLVASPPPGEDLAGQGGDRIEAVIRHRIFGDITSEETGRRVKEAACEIAALLRYSGLAPDLAGQGEPVASSLQKRNAEWMKVAFDGDPTDLAERVARFGEEALELQQALGQSREDAIALVEYVYGRPVGEPGVEFGQAAGSLACLAEQAGHDLNACEEIELARISKPEFISKLRAKRSTRHGRGPLPGFSDPAPSRPADREEIARALELGVCGRCKRDCVGSGQGLTPSDATCTHQRCAWYAPTIERQIERLLALRDAPRDAGDGWRLVPSEPTQAMWAAFRNADSGGITFHAGYRAMITAASSPNPTDGTQDTDQGGM